MSIRAQSDGYRCKIWSEVNPCWLRQNTALHKFVLGDYQERSLEMIYFDVLLCRKSTFCFLAIVPALPSRIQCVSINGVLHSCHACPYVRLYACLYVRKTNLCRPQEGLTNDVRPPPPTPSVLQCDRRRSPHVLRPCHVVSQARRVWGTGLICALGRQGGGKGGSDPGNCSVRNLFYGVALVAHHPLLCSSCSTPCHTEWILGTTPDTAHGVSTSCRLCQLCMLDCKQKPWLQDGRVCVRCRPSNAGHRPKYTRPGNGDKCNPVSAVA